MNSTKISILLPSRGRTDILKRSVESLLNTSDDPGSIQFILGFDNDDKESSQYFVDEIVPLLEKVDSKYLVLEFAPIGYENLHKYLNIMAKHALAPWWVFWNDDAVMLDDHWDTTISAQGDRFCIQAFDTHNLHPYSIFPIVPRTWYELLGHLSQHQLNDAYISQIAWMLDIMVRIPIRVEHERFDLTGKNEDDTYKNRIIHEGDVQHPRDFNHQSNRRLRIQDANKLVTYLRSKGHEIAWWEDLLAGKKDPWEKMLASDVNNMLKRVSPV